MRVMPLSIGTIHFVGIGGIGMSGIASILHDLGYIVQGSDLTKNSNVERLLDLKIPIFIGHKAEHVKDAQVVVISSAVKETNSEVVEALRRGIPVVRRADMLAEIMRLKWPIAVTGTHGKTTTTSLIGTMLETAGYDPTIINGGIINAYNTNIRLGKGEWMVVEADESDGSFLKIPSVVSVITNMDPEHLDYWKTPQAMYEGYKQFLQNVPFYGFALICCDHPGLAQLAEQFSNKYILTYGFSKQAHFRVSRCFSDKSGFTFEVTVAKPKGTERHMGPFRLPLLGRHNVQNALVAIAIGIEFGIPNGKIQRALSEFQGVKRRFTKVGEIGNVVVIDDYAHHPVEIAAVLHAAKQAGSNRIIAVVQPHRYSRVQSLFKDFCQCFNEADTVIVADIYAAGETPIEGITRDSLVEGIRKEGHKSVVPLSSHEHLAEMIAEIAKPFDMIICLGAGSITSWAYALVSQLETLKCGKKTHGFVR